MSDHLKNSRRKFIRDGFTFLGTSAVGASTIGPLSQDISNSNISDPGQIPINNILIDNEQINNMYGHGLKKVGVVDVEGWASKRESILRRSKTMLGQPPESKSKFTSSRIIEENQRDGYNELKVRFSSGTGDEINGYLLIPDGANSSSAFPAIMALHSTGPGATQAVGLNPKENRMYGKDLAQRGYVVLAIDVISAGERVYSGYDPYYTKEFYNKYPHWSAMDKMVYDHKRGIDYLSSIDFVDSSRIGCIGHSLGGYNSFFLQAFDSRVKAAVSSCGLSPMGGTNSPFQFARNDWFVHFNPVTRDFLRSGMVPCDMHEFMALCAPRHLFNYSAKQDSIYCPKSHQTSRGFASWWESVDEGLNQISKVYNLMGKSDHFVRVEENGDHDFPAPIRKQAYEWLDKVL